MGRDAPAMHSAHGVGLAREATYMNLVMVWQLFALNEASEGAVDGEPVDSVCWIGFPVKFLLEVFKVRLLGHCIMECYVGYVGQHTVVVYTGGDSHLLSAGWCIWVSLGGLEASCLWHETKCPT